jgi:hypothetical protein
LIRIIIIRQLRPKQANAGLKMVSCDFDVL